MSDDERDDAAAEASAAPFAVADMCSKCKLAAPVARFFYEPMCRACFGLLVSRRVLGAMTGRHALAAGDAVCIALSGGAASRTLLHLVAGLVARRSTPRVALHAVFVNEAAALAPSSAAAASEWNAAASGIGDDVRAAYSVNVTVAPIEDALDDAAFSAAMSTLSAAPTTATPSAGPSELPALGVPPRERLAAFLGRFRTLSAREDAVDMLRDIALRRTALQLGCKVLCLGTCADRVAALVLGDAIRGAPERLASHASLRDRVQSGDDRLTVLQPVREVSARDVALFARFERLPVLALPGLTTGMHGKASLSRLTHTFLATMQAASRSTSNTVVRATERLAQHPQAELAPRCALCSRRVHPGDITSADPPDAPAPLSPPAARRPVCHSCMRMLQETRPP